MWLQYYYVFALGFLGQIGGEALPPDGTPPGISNSWYWCGLLELSDARLWEMAISRQIGAHCWIDITPSASSDCEFRVKGKPSLVGYDGIPQTTGGLGGGCVFNDPSISCQYYDTEFPLTQEERDGMCTDSIVGNAAAQLKYGIRHGYCTDDPADRCELGEDDDEEEKEEDPYIVGPISEMPPMGEQDPSSLELTLSSTTIQPTEVEDPSSLEDYLTMVPSTTLQPTEEQDPSSLEVILSLEPTTIQPTEEQDLSSLEPLTLSLEPTTLQPTVDQLTLSLEPTTLQPTQESSSLELTLTLEPNTTMQPSDDLGSTLEPSHSLDPHETLHPSAFEPPLNLKPNTTVQATGENDLSSNEVDFGLEINDALQSSAEQDVSSLEPVVEKELGTTDLNVIQQTKWAPFSKAERLEFFPKRSPPTFPSNSNATRVVSAFQSAVVYDLTARPNLGGPNPGVDDFGFEWANTTVVDANESIPFWERTAFFHAVLSGDGEHLVGGRSRVDFNFQPFTTHVEVYSFNGTVWQEKYILPSFYEQENKTSGDSNATREVVIGFTNGNSVATSFDGSVVAFLVHVMKWTGIGWDYANKGGVRVHSWNGTDYVQVGDTVLVEDNITGNPGEIPLLDDDGIGNFQMDSNGRSIFMDGLLYELGDSATGKPQWLLADTGLITGSLSARLSPDFTRLATQGPGDEIVSIYERSQESGKWVRIAMIEAPYRRNLNGTSFGASFAWSEDGKTLAIGAPSQGRRPLQSAVLKQEKISGAVYVFQEYKCTARCTFVQVGDVPCRGLQCGEIVHVSPDGQRVLFSFQEGDPMRVYFASYTRVDAPSSFGVTEYVEKASEYAERKWSASAEKGPNAERGGPGLRASASQAKEIGPGSGSGSQVTESSKATESNLAEALRDIEIYEESNDQTSAACAFWLLESCFLQAGMISMIWLS